jgi:hypothetical protein
LDLAKDHNRDTIQKAVALWQKKYPKANDPHMTEAKALQASLRHHEALGIKNLCLFIDGRLDGVVLYHLTHDQKYLVLNHLKVDYETPFIFDYLTCQAAKEAVKSGVPFINMEMDLGIEGLKNHKMGLRPVSFHKKYTLTPK